MKKLILIITFLFIKASYSCDPAPDFIILGKDTLALRSNLNATRLFKAYWRARRKLVEEGGRSTACYAFREMWEIKNDSLFLNNIVACHSSLRVLDSESFKKLKVSKVSEEIINKIKPLCDQMYLNTTSMCNDLKELLTDEELEENINAIMRSQSRIFGGRTYLDYQHLLKKAYRKNRGFAKSYTNLLFVEEGNFVDSMLIYWHKPTDKEVIYNFKNGKVKSSKIIDAIHLKEKYKGKSIDISTFNFPVFENWHLVDSSKANYYYRQMKSEIKYYKKPKRARWLKSSRFKKTYRILNNKIKHNSENYEFEDFRFSKLLFKGRIYGEFEVPYIGYIEGKNIKENKFIKIVVLFSGIEVHQIVIETNNKDELNSLFLNVISNISYKKIRKL